MGRDVYRLANGMDVTISIRAPHMGRDAPSGSTSWR